MIETTETRVIGAILFDYQEAAVAFETLQPDHFFGIRNKPIFAEMLGIFAKNEDVNLSALVETGKFQQDMEYILDITSTVVSTVGIKEDCRMVKNAFVRRQIVRHSTEIIERAGDEQIPVQELVSDIEAFAMGLNTDTTSDRLKSARELMGETAEKYDLIQKGQQQGILTGFSRMDDYLYGFQPKKMYTLAGNPGTGKTALAMTLALQMKVKTLFFSLEMDSEELSDRMVAATAGMNSRDLKDRHRMKLLLKSILNSMNTIADKNIWIDDYPDQTVQQIVSKCRRHKMEHGLDFVIIDYLQYIKISGQHESRVAAFSEISKGLKSAAKTIGIPFLVLSSLNRGPEYRGDKRPVMADLRECGQIEFDSHAVIMLYSDWIYNKSAEKGKTEVIYRKNRGGPLGTHFLRFELENNRFINYHKDGWE